jgi:hypothetical protein
LEHPAEARKTHLDIVDLSRQRIEENFEVKHVGGYKQAVCVGIVCEFEQ